MVMGGALNVLLSHPKLQNSPHHAPKTTSHARGPPSGTSSFSSELETSRGFDIEIMVEEDLVPPSAGTLSIFPLDSRLSGTASVSNNVFIISRMKLSYNLTDAKDMCAVITSLISISNFSLLDDHLDNNY